MFYLKYLLLVFIVNRKICVCSKNDGSLFKFQNVFAITANFFAENFNENDAKRNVLNQSEKTTINELINNYTKRIEKSFQETPFQSHLINKREISTLDNIPGVYIFNRMQEIGQITAHFPLDIILIKVKINKVEFTYVATIDSEFTRERPEQLLNIYRYQNDNFVLIHKEYVKAAIKLETFEYENENYLILAKNKIFLPTLNQYEDNPSVIYKINSDGTLNLVQSILKRSVVIDIIVWSYMNEIFLIFLEDYDVSNFDIVLPIYRWAGKHFDVLHEIKVYNPKSIKAFTIDGFNYLAVANYQNSYDETDILSEIFRYNVENDRFESYQKILTYAALDVEYFAFKSKNYLESYLIFGNSYEIGLDGSKIKNTNSIVYKFVDGYFIPFQGLLINDIHKINSIQGINGEFILMVLSKIDQVRLFQYDGWRFIEIQFENVPKILQCGVISLRYYIVESNIFLLVAHELDDGSLVNILSPKFDYLNMVHNFYEDMDNWSSQMTTLINEQNSYIENLIGQMGVDFENFEFLNIYENDNEHFSRVKNQIQEEEIQLTPNQLEDIDNELDQITVYLDSIEAEYEKTIKPVDIEYEQNVQFDEIILNCNDESCNFDNINIDTLNGQDMNDFFANIVNIDTDSINIMDSIEFEDILIDTKIHPKTINNHDVQDIIYLNQNIDISESFLVNGEIIFDSHLFVQGRIDDVKIDFEHVILFDNDQIINGDLVVDEVTAKNLYSPNMNELNFKKESQQFQNSTLLKTKTIFSVETNDLMIGNLLNGIDLGTINKFALRKAQNNQIISSTYTFDELHIKELITDSYISNVKIPDDLIPIHATDGSTYFIEQDIEFVQDLIVNDLTVIDELNQIKVIDQKLDILLKNASEKQFITGKKVFRNVDLFGPLHLQGHIKSGVMEQMNPVSMINEKVIVESDFVISGDVTVENLLQCLDMKSANGHSFHRLKDGLLLDENIPNMIVFRDQIHIEELNARSINKQNPDDWLIMGTDKPQVILGKKSVPNDLVIASGSVVENINGINLANLNENVLKSDGLQVIDGNIVFENVVATRITTNSTTFKHINLDSAHLFDNLQLQGPINITDCIQTNLLTIQNQIIDPNIKFTDINDAIIIESPNEFVNPLQIENLNQIETINDLNMSDILSISQLWQNEFIFNDNIDFLNDINVDEVVFTGMFDDVIGEDFGNWWLQDVDQHINGTQILINVTVGQNVKLANDIVNNINIHELLGGLVFLDRDEFLNNVIFENNVIADEEITIDGNVTGMKFAKKVLISNNVQNGVHTTDSHFIFDNNLIIDGNLIVNNQISGVNWNTLHKFRDSGKLDNVVINGNVQLRSEPNIEYLNSRNVEEMSDNIWYPNDDNVDLFGIFDFDQMICEDQVELAGRLNGYNLDWLEDNYLSLSRDQVSNGTLHFEDGVTFNQNLYANQSIIDRFLSNVHFDEFLDNVLRYDIDQDIFGGMNFEDFIVTDNFNITGKVNGLDLSKDVMRHDIPESLVTGPKVIRDIIAHNISSSNGLFVQNMDLPKWMNESILLSNGNQFLDSIEFKSVKFLENVILLGILNDEFLFDEDHVLLKNVTQIITGQKTFVGRQNLPFDVYLKTVQMKKFLNGLNVSYLLQNQAFKNENNQFVGLKIFNNSMMAHNLEVEKDMFGIDRNDIFDVVSLQEFNNLESQYYQLSSNADRLIKSLQDQAFYLDGYEVVESNDHNVLSFEINKQIYFIQMFNDNHQMKIDMNFPANQAMLGSLNYDSEIISLVRLLDFNDFKYLFIETKANSSTENFGTHIAKLFQLSNNGFTLTHIISTNGTEDAVSFISPATTEHCVFLLSKHNIFSQIYCLSNENDLQSVMKIPTNSPKDVETLIIDRILYLIIINRYDAVRQQQQQLGATIQVWRVPFDIMNDLPQLTQIIHHVAQPNCLAVINANDNNMNLLAIASGHLQNTMHTGLIDIRRSFFNAYHFILSPLEQCVKVYYNFRLLQNYNLDFLISSFDETTNQFETIQKLHPNAPIDIKFAILPTKELVLYSLSENPTESLIVYIYQGIYNFVRKVTASTIMNGINLQVITNYNLNHYVIVNSNNSSKIIKAIFKGH